MAVEAGTSISGQVAQAIMQVIRNLRISPEPTIVLRKKMVVLDGDTTRMILVEVADDEQYEPISNGDRDGYLLWGCKRPCGVAIGYANQGKTGNNEELRSVRSQIEDAMNSRNLQRAGLDSFEVNANDVSPYGRMVFDPATTPGTDWSVMTFTVETLENKRYGG